MKLSEVKSKHFTCKGIRYEIIGYKEHRGEKCAYCESESGVVQWIRLTVEVDAVQDMR